MNLCSSIALHQRLCPLHPVAGSRGLRALRPCPRATTCISRISNASWRSDLETDSDVELSPILLDLPYAWRQVTAFCCNAAYA